MVLGAVMATCTTHTNTVCPALTTPSHTYTTLLRPWRHTCIGRDAKQINRETICSVRKKEYDKEEGKKKEGRISNMMKKREEGQLEKF